MTEHEMLHKIYEWLAETDRSEMIHPASAGELEMLLDDRHRELGYRDPMRYCTSPGQPSPITEQEQIKQYHAALDGVTALYVAFMEPSADGSVVRQALDALALQVERLPTTLGLVELIEKRRGK